MRRRRVRCAIAGWRGCKEVVRATQVEAVASGGEGNLGLVCKRLLAKVAIFPYIDGAAADAAVFEAVLEPEETVVWLVVRPLAARTTLGVAIPADRLLWPWTDLCDPTGIPRAQIKAAAALDLLEEAPATKTPRPSYVPPFALTVHHIPGRCAVVKAALVQRTIMTRGRVDSVDLREGDRCVSAGAHCGATVDFGNGAAVRLQGQWVGRHRLSLCRGNLDVSFELASVARAGWLSLLFRDHQAAPVKRWCVLVDATIRVFRRRDALRAHRTIHDLSPVEITEKRGAWRLAPSNLIVAHAEPPWSYLFRQFAPTNRVMTA